MGDYPGGAPSSRETVCRSWYSLMSIRRSASGSSFMNVLRGEMSVVGPRPIAGWEAEYQGQGWARLSVKPGLTGTWQISGRSQISWERRMALDVEYVENRSLAGDIWIMLRTPWAILTQRGAV